MHPKIGPGERYEESEQNEQNPCTFKVLKPDIFRHKWFIQRKDDETVSRGVTEILGTEPLPFVNLIGGPDGSALLIGQFEEGDYVESEQEETHVDECLELVFDDTYFNDEEGTDDEGVAEH